MSNFSDGPSGATYTGTLAFPVPAQVILTFAPKVFIFENLGTDDVSFSFDGVNVHGTLPAGISQQRQVPPLQTSVWFRDEGGGGTAILRTTAYNY